MDYYIAKTLNTDFDTAKEKVTEVLKSEGFGVLSEIDIKDKLKEKLDVDFRKYLILGACNPPLAFEALKKEDKIGTMLPCNVILQEHKEGEVEVAAVDPIASMMAIENPDLSETAKTVRAKLQKVIEKLQ